MTAATATTDTRNEINEPPGSKLPTSPVLSVERRAATELPDPERAVPPKPVQNLPKGQILSC
eukprot:4247603-Amphidinium_carterae.1